jgi:hypothetical protein
MVLLFAAKLVRFSNTENVLSSPFLALSIKWGSADCVIGSVSRLQENETFLLSMRRLILHHLLHALASLAVGDIDEVDVCG